jgi:hypothetical protein
MNRADRRDRASRKYNSRVALTKLRGIRLNPHLEHDLKSMATPCSCEMCRNPRRTACSTKERLTRQELRVLS